MHKNKIAAVVLILSAFVFILLVLFVERISATAMYAIAFFMVAIAALMWYLYGRGLSGRKKRWLLLFFVIPSIVILVMNLLKN